MSTGPLRTCLLSLNPSPGNVRPHVTQPQSKHQPIAIVPNSILYLLPNPTLRRWTMNAFCLLYPSIPFPRRTSSRAFGQHTPAFETRGAYFHSQLETKNSVLRGLLREKYHLHTLPPDGCYQCCLAGCGPTSAYADLDDTEHTLFFVSSYPGAAQGVKPPV